MDIYAYIEKDHNTARDLIKKIQTADNGLDQYAVFEKLKSELLIHAKTEEATFYHAIEKKMPEKTHHAQDEHDEITEYLNELTQIPLSSPRWTQTFDQLKQRLDHHMKEEEQEIMPKARKFLSQQEAEKLGRQMESLKEEAKAEMA